MNKSKYFVFSDESGSWHDINDVYVRSWIVIPEKEYPVLVNISQEIADYIGANELKWNHIAHNKQHIDDLSAINFKVFFTVSSCKNIDWDNKYLITRNFSDSIKKFEFGSIKENVVDYIKERIYRDIKNALFLNYYEKLHIENAKKAIESVIKPTDLELIYRIDSPQVSKDGWESVLKDLSENSINVEFPKSTKTHGIQLSDIIAGALRSIIREDHNKDAAELLVKILKDKFIKNRIDLPNPNLIFYKEMDEATINKCKGIWNI